MKKIVAIILTSIFIASCGEKKMPLPAHHVDVLVLKSMNVAYQLDYPGSITGMADFQVIPRVSGVLFKQLYKEGSFVKKDQPLYEIDPRPFQNQLAASQGQLLRDETAAREYKSILERYQQLYKIGGVSKQDVETATINYKQAVGNVQVDQANIRNDKLNLEYCTVRSPVDGLISERIVTVGTMVNAFQTVLNNINSKTDLYVNFSVPENDRLELQRGMTSGKISVPKDFMFGVNLQLADGSLLNHAGVVNFFDTRISLQNGSWNMRASVDNSSVNDQLLDGQYVHVYLTGASFKNALVVPQAAVFRDDKGAFVYVVNTSNTIEKRPVVTGVMNGSIWVIDSGLKANDKVVINGGMKVTVGDKVTIDSNKEQTQADVTSNT